MTRPDRDPVETLSGCLAALVVLLLCSVAGAALLAAALNVFDYVRGGTP